MQKDFNIPPHELSKFKEKLSQKKCFYLDCESKKIIKAHSIQENGILSYLADDINGQKEVYFLDDEFGFDKKTNSVVSKQLIKRELHHRGISQASTFSGFCEDHDRIFKTTIEDIPYKGTEEQHFFHTYRAYAYFMHKKYEMFKLFSNTGGELSEQLNIAELKNRAKSDSNNPLLQSLNGLLDGVENLVDGLSNTFELLSEECDKELFGLKLKKARLDEIVEKSLFHQMDYIQINIPQIFPLATSTVVQYIDEIARPSADGVVYATEVTISIFPDVQKNTTRIILGSFPENPNWEILKNKLYIMQLESKCKFISNLLLHRGNNIYLSPRMLSKLSQQEQSEIINIRSEKIDGDISVPDFDLNLFNTALSE